LIVSAPEPAGQSGYVAASSLALPIASRREQNPFALTFNSSVVVVTVNTVAAKAVFTGTTMIIIILIMTNEKTFVSMLDFFVYIPKLLKCKNI
jgi:hypothetical protein